MSFTTNLELRIVDNGDNFGDVFTQGNYNANKLEEKIGGYLDDMESLPEIRAGLAELVNTTASLTARTNANQTNINANTNRIVAIENGKGFYINAQGVRINGTITRYVIETTSTGSRGDTYVNTTSTDRDDIIYLHGNVNINLTELIGLTSMTNKKIINATCYVTEYDSSKGAPPSFAVTGVYQPPYQQRYELSFEATSTVVLHQRLTQGGGSDIWVPSLVRNFQDIPVVVIFELFQRN